MILPSKQVRSPIAIRFLVLGCVLSLGVAARALAQQPEIDGLAARVARAVQSANKTSVVVADFAGPQGNITELGRRLSQELSAALGREGSGLTVLDQDRLRMVLQDNHLLTLDLNSREGIAALGKLVGAETLVLGSVEPRKEGFELSVDVWDLATRKKLGGQTQQLPKTKEWEDLLTRPVPGAEGSIFRQGKGGIGEVECAFCPLPSYTAKGRATKIEGTVVLQVIVTPRGRATDITVVKGLGSGLDEKAIEAVRNWKFKPAYSLGGGPIPVYVRIEVNFRLI